MTGGSTTVRSGGRLHFGFRNLSPERDRLFGSAGVGVTSPEVRVTARPADRIACDHDRAAALAERSASLLDVPGAAVVVEEELPRHVGLGSGTQLALATYAAVAYANGVEPRVREHAPALGRGRRSGIGIATFERGGLVVDDGHPTEAVLAGPRDVGEWTAPGVAHRLEVPAAWRFLLVLPDAPPGKSDEEEAASMRAAIDRADAAAAAEIETILHQRVLPAVREDRIAEFGAGITRIDELNGAWFAGAAADRHRSPAGELVAALRESEPIDGVGQSSWGALVYGVTSGDRADAAHAAGRQALEAAGVDGRIWVVSARNHGATIIDSDTNTRTMTTRHHGATNG